MDRCLRGHCPMCSGRLPTCCECGEAFPPWHPDIQGKYIDGEVF